MGISIFDVEDSILDFLGSKKKKATEEEILSHLTKLYSYVYDIKPLMMKAIIKLNDKGYVHADKLFDINNGMLMISKPQQMIEFVLPSFPDIRTPSQMRAYLKNMNERLKNTEYVSRYMSLQRVVEMINNKTMWIARPDTMNDIYEINKFNDWKGKYYTCFMREKDESMAMWSMYSQPWEKGVRISIPTKEFKKWIREKRLVTDKDNHELRKADLYFASVLYADDDGLIQSGTSSKNEDFKPYEYTSMAGFVKDKAWEYEKEVRLHVDVDDYSEKGLLIDVPEELINNMIIMAGPRFEGKLDEVIHDQTGKRLRTVDSKFKDLLGWTPCDSCKKKKIGKAAI